MQPIADYSAPANARLQSLAVSGSSGFSTGYMNTSTATMQFPAAGTAAGSPGNSTRLAATGTSSTTGARNPFAAMPRELRNSQLRSNLLAVAGAFSACSGSSSPSGSGNSLMQTQQQPVQQMQWQPSAMAAAMPATVARVAQPPPPPPPAQYQQPAVTSSAVYGPGAVMLTTSGPQGVTFASHAIQQYVACSSALVANAAAAPSYSSPLPLPMQQQQHGGAASYCSDGSYMSQQQQQQVLLVSRPQQLQFAGQHMCMYSDPLPYSPSGSIAPAQQPVQAQPQLVYVSQEIGAGVPCSMLAMDQQPVVMHQAAMMPAGQQQQQQQPPPPPPRSAVSGVHGSGAVQVGGGGYSQVQQLLQKQQALQAMEQMVQQQLLRLLPDV